MGFDSEKTQKTSFPALPEDSLTRHKRLRLALVNRTFDPVDFPCSDCPDCDRGVGQFETYRSLDVVFAVANAAHAARQEQVRAEAINRACGREHQPIAFTRVTLEEKIDPACNEEGSSFEVSERVEGLEELEMPALAFLLKWIVKSEDTFTEDDSCFVVISKDGLQWLELRPRSVVYVRCRKAVLQSSRQFLLKTALASPDLQRSDTNESPAGFDLLGRHDLLDLFAFPEALEKAMEGHQDYIKRRGLKWRRAAAAVSTFTGLAQEDSSHDAVAGKKNLGLAKVSKLAVQKKITPQTVALKQSLEKVSGIIVDPASSEEPVPFCCCGAYKSFREVPLKIACMRVLGQPAGKILGRQFPGGVGVMDPADVDMSPLLGAYISADTSLTVFFDGKKEYRRWF